MNLERFFSSPQTVVRIFLFLLIGIVVLAGIGSATYQVLNIIDSRKARAEFEDQIEKSVQEVKAQVEASNGKVTIEIDKSKEKSLTSLLAVSDSAEKHNLFNPVLELKESEVKLQPGDRKNETKNDQDKTEAESRTTKLKQPKLGLVGILVNPNYKSAIIKTESGDNISVLEGELISGWQIREITKEKVVLTPDIKKVRIDEAKEARKFVLKLGGGEN